MLRCESGSPDGPWSQTCKAVEYGGSIDVMGNVDTTSPLSTYHQWRMGLLEDSQIKQVWLSEVVNLSPSDFAKGIKALQKSNHYLGAHSNDHLLYNDWTNRNQLLVSYDSFITDLRKNFQAMEDLGIDTRDCKLFIPPYEWWNDSVPNVS